MIKIYGSPQSSAGRCFWCLEELRVEYTSEPISFKDRQHKSENFLKVNPNGKVPVLQDGEFKIWESMAINTYLCDKYAPGLLGDTPEQRGLVSQWSFWALAELQHPLIQIFIQKVFVPQERRDDELIAKMQGKLPTYFETLEGELSRNGSYLLGEAFSLADLNVGSVAFICESIEFDLKTYPAIAEWLLRLSNRDSYQRFKILCE